MVVEYNFCAKTFKKKFNKRLNTPEKEYEDFNHSTKC